MQSVYSTAATDRAMAMKRYPILSIYPEQELDANFYRRDVVVKAMDSGIVVSEFVLQSRNYVHFRANTLGKGMNPLILPAMG